jgi:hypothetical protein
MVGNLVQMHQVEPLRLCNLRNIPQGRKRYLQTKALGTGVLVLPTPRLPGFRRQPPAPWLIDDTRAVTLY